jgi:CSLREA domain-containing protein
MGIFFAMKPFVRLLIALSLSITISTILPGIVAADNVVQAGTMIIVTTSTDELNIDSDCSLREAIRAANTNQPIDACPAGTGSDTVILKSATYNLTKVGINEDDGKIGDLDIFDDLQVVGANLANTIIDGQASDRIFHVHGDVTVKFTNLTLRNGFAPPDSFYGGGAILNGGGEQVAGAIQVINCLLTLNKAANTGGGLDNSGSATLIDVSLISNQAAVGGGIFNGGSLVIDGATFSQNIAEDTGGGLDNNSGATLRNVTISTNSAGGNGGGLFNDGSLTLLNLTIAGNNTGLNNAGTVRIKNSIITGSTSGDNCSGSVSIISEGHNIENTDTCNFDLFTDLINTNPDISPLSDNLGPTLTHALLDESPAIDSGENNSCPLQDQRGALRPADGDENGTEICDIGAYEYAGVFPYYLYLPMLSRH